jgi:hypothetical protein
MGRAAPTLPTAYVLSTEKLYPDPEPGGLGMGIIKQVAV